MEDIQPQALRPKVVTMDTCPPIKDIRIVIHMIHAGIDENSFQKRMMTRVPRMVIDP